MTKTIKKNIKTFLHFFIFLLVFINLGFPKKTLAQFTPLEQLLGCGNSEATNAAERKCCRLNQTDPLQPISSWLWLLEKVPYLGGAALGQINLFRDQTFALQKKIKPIPCYTGYPSTTDPNDPNCVCIPLSQITPSPYKSVENMCKKYLPQAKENPYCLRCAAEQGLWTSIGCLHGNFSKFIMEDIFRIGLGFGGFIAILCIIYAAFTLQTSSGNPEKIKKAQELLTSCIMGLLLIIFSVFILKLIGVNILRIPGFGK